MAARINRESRINRENEAPVTGGKAVTRVLAAARLPAGPGSYGLLSGKR